MNFIKFTLNYLWCKRSHWGKCDFIGACTCYDVVASCGWHDENCQRTRCLQRTQCRVRNLSYQCDCAGTGYNGTVCSVDVNECITPNLGCLNGGICKNSIGNFTCDCTNTGFEGLQCELDLDECTTLRPCITGMLFFLLCKI